MRRFVSLRALKMEWENDMRNEDHRNYAMKAFEAYVQKKLTIESVKLNVNELFGLANTGNGPFTYILRLDQSRQLKPAISAIPNRNDASLILYIGGSDSHQKLNRPESLIKSCEGAMAVYRREGRALNEQDYGHKVAQALTTSLLEYGFTLDDCILDVVHGDGCYNELEFLIGYEETFFHLPPWNRARKGKSSYKDPRTAPY